MKKIYLDTNIYNRPYDDQLQVRIRLETIAIFEILKRVQSKALALVWSFILDFKNSLNPYEGIRIEIEMLERLRISKMRILYFQMMYHMQVMALVVVVVAEIH